jgi:hypothetical protein
MIGHPGALLGILSGGHGLRSECSPRLPVSLMCQKPTEKTRNIHCLPSQAVPQQIYIKVDYLSLWNDLFSKNYIASLQMLMVQKFLSKPLPVLCWITIKIILQCTHLCNTVKMKP